MTSPLRALVTGGAGFIGSHLSRHLLAQGHVVRIVDNLSTGHLENLADIRSDVDFCEADVRSPEVCDRVTRGIDVIFHVAALPSVPRSMRDPIASHECNVNATLYLLESARKNGGRRVVYSSSSSVYGDTPVLPKVENVEPLPRSPYATSKLAGEQYVLAYARAGLLEGIALRYFNVFGPRQDPNGPYAAVIPLLLKSAVSGAPMTINGDGRQTRDFTYVDNVVRANWLAGTEPVANVNGWAVNVGAGARTSLLELVQLANEVTGHTIRLEHREPRVGDVRDSLASLDRAREVLGYVPIISLREGMQRLWEWMAAKGEFAAAQR